MTTELVFMFMLGLTGGFGHCIGMCGGFVLTYSVKLPARPRRWFSFSLLIPHLLYSAGRMMTYAFLGGILGLLGQTLELFNFQGYLQILAGVVMLVIGAELAGWLPNLSNIHLPFFRPFQQLFGSLLKELNYTNCFLIGIVLGFLPCGLVYAAVAESLATGNVAGGMAMMIAFGAGTAPALLLVGLGVNIISGRFKTILFRVSAALVILLGLYTGYKGWKKTSMPTEMLQKKIEMIQDHEHPMQSCCEISLS